MDQHPHEFKICRLLPARQTQRHFIADGLNHGNQLRKNGLIDGKQQGTAVLAVKLEMKEMGIPR